MTPSFLLRFQERAVPGDGRQSQNGTQTVTETREGSPDSDPPRIVAGTLTMTAVRQEAPDEDRDAASYRALPLRRMPETMGTATSTKMREEPDQDPRSYNQSLTYSAIPKATP